MSTLHEYTRDGWCKVSNLTDPHEIGTIYNLSENEGHYARILLKRDRKLARLSINRKRTVPRTRAQEIVDSLRLSPSREYAGRREYIYFLKCQDFVKIGRSGSPKGRLQQIQQGCPFPVEYLGSFVGFGCDEIFLHHELVREPGIKRACGEWFTFAPLIDELMEKLGCS